MPVSLTRPASVTKLFSLLLALLLLFYRVSRHRNLCLQRLLCTLCAAQTAHTTVLLETRLSAEFQLTMEKRRYKVPEYTDVSFDDWDMSRTKSPLNRYDKAEVEDAKKQRESANALAQLLNQ